MGNMSCEHEDYLGIADAGDSATRGGELSEQMIVLDNERMNEVLGVLYAAYQKGEYPYSLDSTRVPQDERHMPETLEHGTIDHAMFLFTVCYYMRGGIKSNDAVIRLGYMYDDMPHLFDAHVARYMDSGEIAQILKRYGLGFQKTVSELWVENARRMSKIWDGDPRNIFEGVNTYDECVRRVKNNKKGDGFIGFQEKMVSMIMYYLMDQNLIPYFNHPLPVDIHVMRVSVETEIVKFVGYAEDDNVLSDELLAILRQAFHDYAERNGIDMLRLCDAVWLLSSTLCGTQPGNTTQEPNGYNARSTDLIALEINTDDEKQRRDYHKSCGSCPLQELCDWNVPSADYYRKGKLRRRGRRVKFPMPHYQEELFGITHARQASRRDIGQKAVAMAQLHKPEAATSQGMLF